MSTGMVDLSPKECRDLVARGRVGRVALCSHDGPQVFPVNFAVVDGDIVFRTSPYTQLGLEVRGRRVAFEVDDLDYDRAAGWSVVVKGEATAVEDPDEIAALRRRVPEPWAPGHRTLFVRLSPHGFTGRRVGDAFESR